MPPQINYRQNRHFTDLDGMRGILAVTVMLYHLGLASIFNRLTGGYLRPGIWELCVDFFFILSGFVLYLSINRTLPSLPVYFKRRLFRLVPLYLITTVIVLSVRPEGFSTSTIVANILMLQPFVGLASINFPGWSVPFELFLPALLVLFAPYLAKLGKKWDVLFLLLSLIGAILFVEFLAHARNIPFGRAFFGLALGMALARMREQSFPAKPRPWLVISMFTVATVIMAVSGTFPLTAAFFPIVSCICIFFGTETRTFLSSPPFQAIGRWSYSIYLAHIPVLTIYQTFFGSSAGSVSAKLIIIAITLMSSALLYRFVESPLITANRKLPQTAP